MTYNDLAKQNKLKAIREQKGVTQHALAIVSFQTTCEISRYECGKRMPSYPVLRRMARFLGVSVEEIYPGFQEFNREIDESVDKIKEIIPKHFDPE